MLRLHGFQRGKAWTATALKTYGAVNRAALLAECRARGLEPTGTVADLKARLGRSDEGLLEAADWQPLAAAGLTIASACLCIAISRQVYFCPSRQI